MEIVIEDVISEKQTNKKAPSKVLASKPTKLPTKIAQLSKETSYLISSLKSDDSIIKLNSSKSPILYKIESVSTGDDPSTLLLKIKEKDQTETQTQSIS